MARFNNKRLDVPVNVREGHSGEEVYSHPSYGIIKVSNVTSGRDANSFYGSEVGVSNYIEITLSECETDQHLGQSWYHGRGAVSRIKMTPVQYAEMIANPNSEGIPCTILYTARDGYITYKPHSTQVEYTKQKLDDATSNLSGKLSQRKEKAKEILTRKGALKDQDKKDLIDLITGMDRDISSTIPFYEGCLEEHLERMVMEAKTEVESFVASAYTKLGKNVMENPEAFKLLLEDKNND